MGKRWHPNEDETLRLLYTAREPWQTIAQAFGVSRVAAKARGAKLGLNWRDGPRVLSQGRAARSILRSTDAATPIEPGARLRPPLPAGHPISWSLVTALTPCIWDTALERAWGRSRER